MNQRTIIQLKAELDARKEQHANLVEELSEQWEAKLKEAQEDYQRLVVSGCMMSFMYKKLSHTAQNVRLRPHVQKLPYTARNVHSRVGCAKSALYSTKCTLESRMCKNCSIQQNLNLCSCEEIF